MQVQTPIDVRFFAPAADEENMLMVLIFYFPLLATEIDIPWKALLLLKRQALGYSLT